MKQMLESRINNAVQKMAFAVCVAVLSFLTSVKTFAQNTVPENVNVDISADTGSAGWYAQPWVWVVGVAVFIVIIVAITRGNSRRDA